ncbi:unnamed protein product [Pocillopora meandrina]|uniref:Uncharacterized protein n=1 Tax=Pocillopora meandrina TaxID=46732 RepID=A0AAU9W757_9CNID|nr:unnamed protein product [Pocillopora meandrina]
MDTFIAGLNLYLRPVFSVQKFIFALRKQSFPQVILEILQFQISEFHFPGFKHKTCDKSFLPRDIENVTKANMRLDLLLMVSCVLLVFSMALGEFSDEPMIYSWCRMNLSYFITSPLRKRVKHRQGKKSWPWSDDDNERLWPWQRDVKDEQDKRIWPWQGSNDAKKDERVWPWQRDAAKKDATDERFWPWQRDDKKDDRLWPWKSDTEKETAGE